MVRGNEKQMIYHGSTKNMKSFDFRSNGEVTRIGCTVTSANKVEYEALNSAIAFFMSFMLFMVKHIHGSGRRPGCVL